MDRVIDSVDTRELAARAGDGLVVRLLWHPGSNDVLVEIADGRRDLQLVFAVPPERAADAFDHPFAYAAKTCDLADAGDVAAMTS